jgi:hypothetical protein
MIERPEVNAYAVDSLTFVRDGDAVCICGVICASSGICKLRSSGIARL